MTKSGALFFRLLSVAALSAMSYAAVADRIQGAVTGGPSVALPGGVHRLALPQNDLGRVDASMQFGSIMLQMSPTASQQRALTQLLAQQQDRHSPNYHKWLTPEQWADRFGLSQNDIQKVNAWLKTQGFTVKYVARGRNWILFSGSAAQVEIAFGTEIHQFNLNGEMHVANATVPKIPAALAGIVTGIQGLNDFHLRPRVHVRPSYYSSQYNAAFIAPGDIKKLYDVDPLYTGGIDGTGQKFAIIGQTDIYLSDLNNFRSGFGLTTISATNCKTKSAAPSDVITSCSDPLLSYVVAGGLADPGVPDKMGDVAEADVDLEWAGAVARNAQLVYVNAPATFSANGGLVSGGVWTAWMWAVDNNVAPVISMSYGICEFGDNTVSSDEIELQKANTQGITFVNSSGDSGSAECDFGGAGGTLTSTNLATQGLAVSYPASSPEVTGVGGTAIPLSNFGSNYWATTNATDGGSALSYVPEQAWNDDLEFSQFCQTNASNSFCSSGNGTGTAITSEATAQQAIGPSSTGGGISNCSVQTAGNSACVSGFPQPDWQSVSIAGQASGRLTPDVSLLATPNFPGYLFCTELSELGDTGTGSSCSPGGAAGITNSIALKSPAIIGGTSISSPVFGGMVVLLNQYLGAAQGNINPSLYSLAATPTNGAFHPVTLGDNNVSCEAGTPSGEPWDLVCPMTGVFGFDGTNADAVTGYNIVTGLGSVDLNQLAIAWKAMETAPGFTLSSSSAALSASAGTNTGSSTITVTPTNAFAGSVTLTCTGLPTGATCQFTPASTSTTSTLVIQTTSAMSGVPSASVVITGTDTTGTITASTAVALTVSGGTQTFTLQSNLGANGTLSVTRGTPGNVQLGVYSTDGFVVTTNGISQTALPVTYACSGLPSESTCTFSPPSPTQAPGVTVSIATTAPTARLQRPLDRGTKIFYALMLPGLLGLLITAGASKRQRGMIRLLGLIVVLSLSALWITSCGGGSSGGGGGSNPGTPIGSYTITINATTSNAAISSSTKFTLKVN